MNSPQAPIDARRVAPATARNRDPILDVLRSALPSSGTVLEVASGSGEHGVYFAQALPDIQWQPTDPDQQALASIEAWRSSVGTPNLHSPARLDAASSDWPVSRADAVVCINMVHISPWEATLGLMAGASRVLQSGAPLILYGPYKREGHDLEPSNAAFDQSLKQRNPAWGLRSAEDVTLCARDQGLALERLVEMPANNLMLIFRKI